MKLFKCHAGMPLTAHERTHVVKTYLVVADGWESARARVSNEEPGAELVTIPTETSLLQLTAVNSMSKREFADLRSACSWRELRAPIVAGAVPQDGERNLSTGGFGAKAEREAIFQLEDRIAAAIERSRAGEHDGNEVGGGEFVIYCYGPNANVLYETIESALRGSPLSKGAVVLIRYGKPGACQREVKL